MSYHCGKNCWGFDKCKKRRDCACECGPLKAINPNLYDGCYNACNEPPRPVNHENYMDEFVGGEVMYNYYGIIRPGYDPFHSAQYIAYEEEEERKAEAAATSGKWIKILQIILLAGIVLGTLWLILPTGKKST